MMLSDFAEVCERLEGMEFVTPSCFPESAQIGCQDTHAEGMWFAFPGACGGREPGVRGEPHFPSPPHLDWNQADLGERKAEAKTVNIIQIKKAQGQEATER